MNIWDHILNFLAPPANSWLTVGWMLENEEPFDDGQHAFKPQYITTIFQTHHNLGESMDDSKYRFHDMVIKGPLVVAPEVQVLHRIDKLEKVPLRFKSYTDRNYGREADNDE